jgi:hypothetical protein
MARLVATILAFAALCAPYSALALEQFITGNVAGQSEGVQVTINADNKVTLGWNGEWLKEHADWTTTFKALLIPVNKCNYQNVLAIKLWGDSSVNDGFIMNIKYANKTYLSGKSPELAITSETPAANWNVNTLVPTTWTKSNLLPACQMVPAQMNIRSQVYGNNAEWIWAGKCTDLKIANVFAKIIIPTKCNAPLLEQTANDVIVVTSVSYKYVKVN